jgi:Phasin protein
MATRANTKDATAAITQTVDRIRELNEQIIDTARKAGTGYLDMYEQALEAIAGYQQQLAEASEVDWLQRLIEAQATFTRDMGNLYASSARELLKQR